MQQKISLAILTNRLLTQLALSLQSPNHKQNELRSVQADCILQSIKQKGPCYECGPAAKTPLTKEPCGGKCIEKCKGGKKCQNKECQCPYEKPKDCNGECKKFGTDTDCSGCGDKCYVDKGEKCMGGGCKCPDGKKADFTKDVDNCGKCGKMCKKGEICEHGECKCPADKPVFCGDKCKPSKDFEKDDYNCGTCGNKCEGGKTCKNGKCECPAEKPVFCDNKCKPWKDFKEDDNNCGGCGTKCGEGKTCKDKQCVPKCKYGEEELCNGKCKKTTWGTNEDCSKCGDACTGGKTCNQHKQCKCPYGEKYDGSCKTKPKS
ncbi:unnamed protein product [Alternaria alternata]